MIQQANAARFEINMVNLLPKVSDMMPPRLKPRALPRANNVAVILNVFYPFQTIFKYVYFAIF